VNEQEWHAVEIVAAPDAEAAIEHSLNELGSLGTEINQLRKKKEDDITVVGYFSEPPVPSQLQGQLDLALQAFDLDRSVIRSVKQRTVENEDWLSEWKKHWRPTQIGRFIVAPSWEKLEERDKEIVVRIEPNMAFGTGTHETTRLCLKTIDEYYQPEMSFLDVGTGTGILAIAAAQMGSEQKIIGVDTDANSIGIARENARINQVADQIEFNVGSIDLTTAEFNFVCANLTLDVISPLLPLLVEKTNALLILSGILAEQEKQVVKELQRLDVSKPQIERDGEWIAVIIRR
jgi:ribosomal protein L11 methyltransferase